MSAINGCRKFNTCCDIVDECQSSNQFKEHGMPPCTALKIAEALKPSTNKQGVAITELREAFAEWNETPVEMPSHRLLSAINAVIA